MNQVETVSQETFFTRIKELREQSIDPYVYLEDAFACNEGKKIEIFYRLKTSVEFSKTEKRKIIKCTIPLVKKNETIAHPSVSSIWPNASLFEQELFDFFGIKTGDQQKIFVSNRVDQFPLRKEE